MFAGWPAVAVISIMAFSVVAFIAGGHPQLFAPYFSQHSPAAAVALISVAGLVSLHILVTRYRFSVKTPGQYASGVMVAVVAAIPFMAAVTTADTLLRFPRGINVPPPLALAFYPAMGFTAQLALHVIPLAIVLLIMNSTCRFFSLSRQLWIAVPLVATVEAVFQFSASLNATPDSLSVFVALLVFLFGIVELILFRAKGYLSMLVFRLVYYLYWHVLWGWMRLQLLY